MKIIVSYRIDANLITNRNNFTCENRVKNCLDINCKYCTFDFKGGYSKTVSLSIYLYNRTRSNDSFVLLELISTQNLIYIPIESQFVIADMVFMNDVSGSNTLEIEVANYLVSADYYSKAFISYDEGIYYNDILFNGSQITHDQRWSRLELYGDYKYMQNLVATKRYFFLMFINYNDQLCCVEYKSSKVVHVLLDNVETFNSFEHPWTPDNIIVMAITKTGDLTHFEIQDKCAKGKVVTNKFFSEPVEVEGKINLVKAPHHDDPYFHTIYGIIRNSTRFFHTNMTIIEIVGDFGIRRELKDEVSVSPLVETSDSLGIDSVLKTMRYNTGLSATRFFTGFNENENFVMKVKYWVDLVNFDYYEGKNDDGFANIEDVNSIGLDFAFPDSNKLLYGNYISKDNGKNWDYFSKENLRSDISVIKGGLNSEYFFVPMGRGITIINNDFTEFKDVDNSLPKVPSYACYVNEEKTIGWFSSGLRLMRIKDWDKDDKIVRFFIPELAAFRSISMNEQNLDDVLVSSNKIFRTVNGLADNAYFTRTFSITEFLYSEECLIKVLRRYPSQQNVVFMGVYCEEMKLKGAVGYSVDFGVTWEKKIVDCNVRDMLISSKYSNGSSVLVYVGCESKGILGFHFDTVKKTASFTSVYAAYKEGGKQHDFVDYGCNSLSQDTEGNLYCMGYAIRKNNYVSGVLFIRSLISAGWLGVFLDEYQNDTSLTKDEMGSEFIVVGKDDFENDIPILTFKKCVYFLDLYDMHKMSCIENGKFLFLYWDALLIGTSIGVYGQLFEGNVNPFLPDLNVLEPKDMTLIVKLNKRNFTTVVVVSVLCFVYVVGFILTQTIHCVDIKCCNKQGREKDEVDKESGIVSGLWEDFKNSHLWVSSVFPTKEDRYFTRTQRFTVLILSIFTDLGANALVFSRNEAQNELQWLTTGIITDWIMGYPLSLIEFLFLKIKPFNSSLIEPEKIKSVDEAEVEGKKNAEGEKNVEGGKKEEKKKHISLSECFPVRICDNILSFINEKFVVPITNSPYFVVLAIFSILLFSIGYFLFIPAILFIFSYNYPFIHNYVVVLIGVGCIVLYFFGALYFVIKVIKQRFTDEEKETLLKKRGMFCMLFILSCAFVVLTVTVLCVVVPMYIFFIRMDFIYLFIIIFGLLSLVCVFILWSYFSLFRPGLKKKTKEGALRRFLKKIKSFKNMEEKFKGKRITKMVSLFVGSFKKLRDSQFWFPWWCIYPLYLFVFTLIGCFSFVLIIYGIKFDRLPNSKRQDIEWLKSSLISSLFNIFVSEPYDFFKNIFFLRIGMNLLEVFLKKILLVRTRKEIQSGKGKEKVTKKGEGIEVEEVKVEYVTEVN